MLFQIIQGENISLIKLILSVLASFVVLLLTMPIHEAAHAFTAYKLGDPTAKYQGRLSLNPFKHLDLFGSLSIILFGFGWAKPVPVNSSYFRNPKRDMAITALAGPVSNLIVALVFMIISNIVRFFAPLSDISLNCLYFLNVISIINIQLAVFNLIPISPLDGSRLLTAMLPTKQYYYLMRYERYFFLILMILLFTGILDIPLGFLSRKVTSFLYNIANLPFIFLIRG